MDNYGRRNHEGYLDLTAYEALKNIDQEEKEAQSHEKPRRHKRRRRAKGRKERA